MILLDFNQLVIATIFADHALVGACRESNDESKALIKHMVFNCIRSYKKKFSKEYGDIVICADGANSWRKREFKYYKANRKKGREDSPIDFDFVFSVLHETLEDLRESFPYPVLKFTGAEGDDCIAAVTKYVSENMTSMDGLFETAEPVLILSSDNDFVQLQKYSNVKQYSFIQKKFVTATHKNPKHDLLEKILTGDKGDGVPNICSPDDVFVTEGARQKAFAMKKRFRSFIDAKNPLDACLNDEEKRNFQRNQVMIDLDFIPDSVYDEIIESFRFQLLKKPNKMKMMDYFMKNKMKLMLEVVGEF